MCLKFYVFGSRRPMNKALMITFLYRVSNVTSINQKSSPLNHFKYVSSYYFFLLKVVSVLTQTVLTPSMRHGESSCHYMPPIKIIIKLSIGTKHEVKRHGILYSRWKGAKVFHSRHKSNPKLCFFCTLPNVSITINYSTAV